MLSLFDFIAVAAAARTDYILSYDWKFASESFPKPKNCSASKFPVDLTDKQCFGLKNQAQVADEETCRETCCGSDECTVWQWCRPGHACSPANSCWTGDDVDVYSCTSTQSGWASSGRGDGPGPAPTPQPGDKCADGSWCSASYDDAAWRNITLPHDMVVEGVFTETAEKSHGYLPSAIGRYRKRFEVPASAHGMHVRLDFEGAMAKSIVYLNGVCLGGHGSGYTPFGFELSAANVSKLVRYGATNVLAVHVDSQVDDSWWYDGGGIYRNVWLTVTPPLHFEQWGVYAPSIVAEHTISVDATTAQAMLYPSIEVVNDGPGAISFTLTSIVSFGGAEVGRAVSVGLIATAQDRATLNQTIDLGTAHLWGITHPNLYTLTTILTPIEPVEAADTQASDVLNTTFGVRTIRFDATNGFFLNGQATKILGCANHQDIAGLGTAVPDALQAYRITALQEFGANAWRTAHNQPSKALLEAADRLGFLVWDENHHNGQPYEMELLIRRECARPLHTAPLMHPPVYSRASLLLTVASIRSPSLARASSAAATTHRL
jgi:beta-galactosidase/beta-glucuronidase